MSKKILIIGGNSFIGYYTALQFLESGYEVTVTTRDERNSDYFMRKNIRNIRFDLNCKEDINNLPTECFESVILLAGLLPANVTSSVEDLEMNPQYITTNVIGLTHLLNYCMRNRIARLISTTSYADTIGLWSNERVICESDPLSYHFSGDHAVYVISRNTASDMSRYYNEEYGMKNIIFRLPPVYGVGPHTQLYDNGVLRKSGIALFIERAEQGQDITVYGGDCFRDIVYVKDVAQAFVQASSSPHAINLYNIMSGRSVSLYEQAVAISRVFSGGRAEVRRDVTKPNNSRSYRYSIQRAKEDMGYDPQYVDFEDMMCDYKQELRNREVLNFFNLLNNND